MQQKRRLYKDTRSTILLFLVPAFILYFVLVVFPIFQSARYSLYRWDGLGPLSRFIGLENYKEIFKDPVFWTSLKNNLIVVFFSIATQMPPALFLAIILTGRIKGKSFLRTVYFAPQIVSTVAASYSPIFRLVMLRSPTV